MTSWILKNTNLVDWLKEFHFSALSEKLFGKSFIFLSFLLLFFFHFSSLKLDANASVLPPPELPQRQTGVFPIQLLDLCTHCAEEACARAQRGQGRKRSNVAKYTLYGSSLSLGTFW